MNGNPYVFAWGEGGLHAYNASGGSVFLHSTSPDTVAQTFKPGTIHGRGAAGNPGNRFEGSHQEAEEGFLQEAPNTVFLPDQLRTVLARNQSPDVGFEVSVNPYRGCEHGCSYCYARPTHEYLGFSAGLDFESKIFVKERAPELLREELGKKSWQPQPVIFSGVTDCYQPVERRLELTRRCLAVMVECRNPAFIITKNYLVTRDIDLLKELSQFQAAGVCLSVTTLDEELCGKLEPRASRPARRLEAIRMLSGAGIPVSVNVAPVIPGLTDHEIPRILEAAAQAGARWAGMTVLRLPYGVKALFAQWLEHHEPLKAEKILLRIEDIRGGKRNDSTFGRRMRGQGPFAEAISRLFHLSRRKAGLRSGGPELSVAAFRRPIQVGNQLPLF